MLHGSWPWNRPLSAVREGGGRGPKRAYLPQVDVLEGRSLLAVVGLSVSAAPHFLHPSSPATTEVVVAARFRDTTPGTVPSLTFKVVDEYGQVQPVGVVSLIPQADGQYRVSIPVQLEASVRAGDRNGRKYTISVTAEDDGSHKTASTTVIVQQVHGHHVRGGAASPPRIGVG